MVPDTLGVTTNDDHTTNYLYDANDRLVLEKKYLLNNSPDPAARRAADSIPKRNTG